MSGIYIHIPFCKTRCIYCDFFSTTQLELREQYVNALCREVIIQQDYLKSDTVQSIYFGGGTPSQLTVQQIGRILEAIKQIHPISSDCEITIELNPDDVNQEYADGLFQLGMNRVSLGIQSFNDNILHFIHRRHTGQQAIDAVKRLQNSGFHNISIDLMFGFPNQTIDDWNQDIMKATSLEVQHISAYALMYENGTQLYQFLHDGKIQEIDEELSLSMYMTLINQLRKNGYEHYEISNFALSGYRSRHNSSYWNNTSYLGIGAGAHSYDGHHRKSNINNLQTYLRGIHEGKPCEEIETLTLHQQFNETVMTRLRTSEGINIDKMLQRFGQPLLDHLMNAAASYLKTGQLKSDNMTISLTEKGIFTSNEIISSLFI